MVYDSGDPYDIYYYQSMQQTIDSAGSEWESLYRQYYSSLSYGVCEQDGTYGRSNVTDPKTFFQEPLKDDQIQFTINFNSNGILKVLDIKGNRDDDITRIKESLTRFEFYDTPGGKTGRELPLQRRGIPGTQGHDRGVSVQSVPDVRLYGCQV